MNGQRAWRTCVECGRRVPSVNYRDRGYDCATWLGHRAGCGLRAADLAGRPPLIVFMLDGMTVDELFTAPVHGGE